jgi:hypothetical protein
MGNANLSQKKRNDFFVKMTKSKKAKNIVYSRYHLDNLTFNNRLSFLHNFVTNFLINYSKVNYKISYWEKDERVESVLKKISRNSVIELYRPYRGKIKSGIVFLSENILDVKFLNEIISVHFNHEQAKNPSLNMRLQISLECVEQIYFLDIYDDRGFDFFIKKQQGKQ